LDQYPLRPPEDGAPPPAPARRRSTPFAGPTLALRYGRPGSFGGGSDRASSAAAVPAPPDSGETRVEIYYAAKPGLLLSTVSNLDTLGLDIQ
jgi:hypothetical protein